ncbi:Regulator of ribonuclease activity B [Candidatus Hartigia pinicola]|nr:Regulator of ribonuclease activity B [Candidatus Hartigia pinicola]
MIDKVKLKAQYKKTSLIIEELLNDGSDPDALYAIEHHFSANTFALLQKALVEAYKLGYRVSNTEEIELELGITLMCYDFIIECTLSATLINLQVNQLMQLAESIGSHYDGWGTYFEDSDAQYNNVFKQIH